MLWSKPAIAGLRRAQVPLMLALALSCKTDATAPPELAQCQVSAVSVTPAQVTVEVGKTVTLSVSVSQENCSNLQVAWSSSNTAVATVSGGVVTGVAAGSVNVTATANGVAGGATVDVTTPPPTSLTWQFSRYVAVGAGDPPFGGEVFAIAGTSATDIYAGAAGRVHRFDGTRWTLIRESGNPLYGMWAAASGDLFVVGGTGVDRWQGGAWQAFPFGGSWKAIWGTGPADVLAVGFGGGIRHFDGNGWTPMTSGSTANLEAVFGFASSDVFAVGSGGTILHFDGSQWTTMTSGTTENLMAVWGSGPSNVFASGNNILLRFDGNTWSSLPLPPGTNASLWGLGGTGPNDVHAVGSNNTALRFDGVSVTKVPASTTSRLWAVWGTRNELFAGGDNVTLRYANGQWEKLSWVPDLRGVIALGATDAVAVGDEGTILRYNGTSWNPMSSGTNARLYSVAAAGAGEIWAVGATHPTGNAIVLRSDGQSWQEATLPVGALASLYSVSVASAGRVSAAGSSGHAMRLTGGTWVYENVGLTQSLRAIWGGATDDVWAVGDNGVAVRFDGVTWQSRASGTSNRLWGIWGTNSSDVWAVGDAGTAVHYDGSSWTAMPQLGTLPLHDVWGTAPTDVWAIGSGGAVHHFDGNAWSTVIPNDFNRRLSAIHGAGGRVFVAGPGGTIGVAR